MSRRGHWRHGPRSIEYLDELSNSVGANVSTDSIALFDKIPERRNQAIELAATVRKLSAIATKDILPEDGNAITAKVQDTVDKTIDPLGPVPIAANVTELAAWTAIGNVLLNLDEVLMKR